MSTPKGPEDLIEFPCHYTFKAIGTSGETFPSQVIDAASKHVEVPQDAVLIRPSGKGNYQSVSIVARLENYQQLTAIYAEIKLVAGLKMLL